MVFPLVVTPGARLSDMRLSQYEIEMLLDCFLGGEMIMAVSTSRPIRRKRRFCHADILLVIASPLKSTFSK